MLRRLKIFEPLSYLRIKNSQIKLFSFYIPLILTAFFLAAYHFLPLKLNVFGNDGLIASISQLLSVLVGFYIASLAAVATFPNENLDQSIKGESATLKNLRGGKKNNENLTRRRFLCLLFGYCSWLSMYLFIFGTLSKLIENNIQMIVKPEYHELLIMAFLCIYIFSFINLMVTTLLGLSYLTERIHRP